MKCPRCQGQGFQVITFKGKDYLQCVTCHFWTTKVVETFGETDVEEVKRVGREHSPK
jgi:transcriptional regulator NrdR family protein